MTLAGDVSLEETNVAAVALAEREFGRLDAVVLNAGILTAEIERRVPLQRFAEPREQAEAVWFLTSPAASYVTATTLVVDGGLDASLGILPLPAVRR